MIFKTCLVAHFSDKEVPAFAESRVVHFKIQFHGILPGIPEVENRICGTAVARPVKEFSAVIHSHGNQRLPAGADALQQFRHTVNALRISALCYVRLRETILEIGQNRMISKFCEFFVKRVL